MPSANVKVRFYYYSGIQGYYINGYYRIYVDILTREKLSSIKLFIWTSFVGQFIQSVGLERIG